ncbi:hypothetical protein I79_018665 [Cricetulus griseus]|uniref:Secreted protein n=1 Tax=Cricetulus griseus TaxID=10029 RepID=G3I5C1_CRIGR|nr:hypothetical protein I79_018665 [Cricetulus griseus]
MLDSPAASASLAVLSRICLAVLPTRSLLQGPKGSTVLKEQVAPPGLRQTQDLLSRAISDCQLDVMCASGRH